MFGKIEKNEKNIENDVKHETNVFPTSSVTAEKKDIFSLNTNNSSLEEALKQASDSLFSEIKEYLNDDAVTDIEWDGDNLWITKIGIGCYIEDKKLSYNYTENLAIRLANIMRVNFSKANPVLEAHTEELRISVFHESRCGKKSFTIRKVPTNLRYNHEMLIEKGTLPEPLLNFLENCVIAHCNIIIGGRPHAGKTELLKYLSCFIPANEKVLTLEDNIEIHYKQIHPKKKCVQFLVDDNYNYTASIKAVLRHNADWLLLSEARGPEVVELLNGLSTGSFCMTTIHLDRVPDIPDRMYNMLGSGEETPRFINNIYRYIDVGLIIKADKKENRVVTEMGFFDRENGKNLYVPFYSNDDKELKLSDLPLNIRSAFEKYNIADPCKRPLYSEERGGYIE